jgi:protein-S-isoprenylcysteine O-methyltransferase Ste14
MDQEGSPVKQAVALVLLVAIVVSIFDPIGAIWILAGSLLGAAAALAVLAISVWRSFTFRNEDTHW